MSSQQQIPLSHHFFHKLSGLYYHDIHDPIPIDSVCRLLSVFLCKRLDINKENYKAKCTLKRIDKKTDKEIFTFLPCEWENNFLRAEPSDYVDLMKNNAETLFKLKIITDKKLGTTPLQSSWCKVKDRNGNERNLFSLLNQFEQIRHTLSHNQVGQLQTTDFILECLYVMEDVLTICDYRSTHTMQALQDFKQEIQKYNIGTLDEMQFKEKEIVSLSAELELRIQELQKSKAHFEEVQEMMYRLEYENAKLNDTISMFKQQQEQYIRTQQVQQSQQLQQSISKGRSKQEQLPQPTNENDLHITTLSDSESLPTVFSHADSNKHALTIQDLQNHIAIIQHSHTTLKALNARRNKAMDELLNQPKKKKRPVIVPLVNFGIAKKRAIIAVLAICGISGAMYASGLLSTVFQPTIQSASISDTIRNHKPTGPSGMTQRELDSLQKIYGKYADSSTSSKSQQQQKQTNTPNGGVGQIVPSRKQSSFRPIRLVYIDIMTKSPSAVTYLLRNIKVDDLIQCNGTQFECRNESSRKDIESKLRSIIDSAIPHSEPWGAMLHSVQTAQGISKVISTSQSGRGLPYIVYFVNDMNEKDMNAYSDSRFKNELQKLQSQGITVECLVGKNTKFNTKKLGDNAVQTLFKFVL
jgi:hypothetical protein